MSEKVDSDRRVLILMPTGRDGPAAAEFLQKVGLATTICSTLEQLVAEIQGGAAVVLLAEEALFGKDPDRLVHWARQQSKWSDLPFVILTSRQDQAAIGKWRNKLVAELHNVSLLERPVQTITLTSTIRAAVRARLRQYEVRALLQAQADAAAELERQIQARTGELAQANAELRAQMAERARMEEVLRQAQKIEAIGQLTGGVAHDFNNLLMVISGGLEMLDRQKDPARRQRLMDGMHQAAQRGSGLTRQLLAFSRRSPLKPEPVDLELQIGGMRELLDRSLRGDVHVEITLAQGLWPVKVDPSELELVILNLAVNSRDAMPQGGVILITAENTGPHDDISLDGEFVQLSVTDQGIGMSDEVKAHVFEPFYTTKEIGRGSGLGLAQVHGFVTQSGGRVEIQSEVGRGTTVSILLPRSLEEPPHLEHRLIDLNVESRQPERRGAILLVEDDDEVAALVTEMLEQLGFEVTRAASAMAALGALSNERHVDLVLSDIMMPGGMDGVELAREIRQRRRGLPILLTSGYAETAIDSAAAIGIRILPKPYQLNELAAALDTAMSIH